MNKNDHLKLIAILAMIIDHVGYFFYPSLYGLRIVGRLAFPLFCHQIAQGYQITSNLQKYMQRLLIYGLISQPIYMHLFETNRLNIFFTLLFGLGLIALKDQYIKQLFYLLVLATINFYLGIEYGLYGILLVYLFSYQTELKPAYIFYGIMAFMTIIYIALTMQLLQIFALLIIPLLYIFKRPINYQINKHYFYLFYPIHLLIIKLIVR